MLCWLKLPKCLWFTFHNIKIFFLFNFVPLSFIKSFLIWCRRGNSLQKHFRILTFCMRTTWSSCSNILIRFAEESERLWRKAITFIGCFYLQCFLFKIVQGQYPGLMERKSLKVDTLVTVNLGSQPSNSGESFIR